MCNFFSFVSDSSKPIPDRFMYFDWGMRQKILTGESDYEADSHSSIAHQMGYTAKEEDLLNKYEFNPLTKKFTVDQINNPCNDSRDAELWVNNLDFKNIVPALIIKPIINPFELKASDITPDVIKLLNDWDSVRDSVWASVRASVGDSVGASVWDSVRASVRASVGDSVWDSVWDSVGDSVRDSVWASVWAYISSFLNIEYGYDFSSCVKLWEMGLVPSYDGHTWRLHGGAGGKIVWQGSKEDLLNA